MVKFVKTRKRGGANILSKIGTQFSRRLPRMFPSRRVQQEPPVPIIEERNPDELAILAIMRRLKTLENNIDIISKQMIFDENATIENGITVNKIANDIQMMISGAVVGTDEDTYKIGQATYKIAQANHLIGKLKNIVDKQSTAIAAATNERVNRIGGTQKRKHRKHRKPKKSRKHRKITL